MKHLLLFAVFNLIFCGFTSAQGFLGIKKVQEIQILESSREDVRKIFAGYQLESYKIEDVFNKNSLTIKVRYSRGKCNTNDYSSDLNITQGKAIEINISSKKQIKLDKVQSELQKLGINISNFTKEKTYYNDDNYFVYHNKELGIGLEISHNKVNNIFFMLPQKYYSLMCNKEKAETLFSTESIFDLPVDERFRFYDVSPYANVIKLVLSKTEIVAGNQLNDSQVNKNYSENPEIIGISVLATNPGKDSLEYVYKVTGGKIIGTGRKVLWDLSGIKAGIYEIMVGVDDGCGLCGMVQKKTVTVN